MKSRAGWVGFAALCLLTGSTWVADLVFSAPWPPLLRLCFHDTVVCVALLGSGTAGGLKVRSRVPWEPAGWGAVLFALPVMVFSGAGGTVRSSTELLALALVPTVTVFLGAQRSEGGDLGKLMPAVVAVGGLALVVPFAAPVSAAGFGWLATILVAAFIVALAGIRLHGWLQGGKVMEAAAVASGAAAVVSLAGWLALERGPVELGWRIFGAETAWGLLIDLPLVLLTFWLLREMRPVSFSTRFLLVPVVTILGGMVMVRPSVPWTTWLGLVMVGAAGWMLLREPDAEEPPRLV